MNIVDTVCVCFVRKNSSVIEILNGMLKLFRIKKGFSFDRFRFEASVAKRLNFAIYSTRSATCYPSPGAAGGLEDHGAGQPRGLKETRFQPPGLEFSSVSPRG